MVYITFEPALSAETTVKPPVVGATTIDVSFRARISAAEWDHLWRQGALVELWSNIPVRGAPNDDWKATTFERRATTVATTTTSKKEDVELFASLCMVAPQVSTKTYSYTYRIRYPHGFLHWLGSTTSNGKIKVDSQALWTPGILAGDVNLGKLHDPARWSVWSLPLDAPPIHTSLDKYRPSRTILLVPSDAKHTFDATPTLFIHSKRNTIHIYGDKISCTTPKDTIARAITPQTTLSYAFNESDIPHIPTSVPTCIFVPSTPRTTNATTFELSPLVLGTSRPNTAKVSTSDFKALQFSKDEDAAFLLHSSIDNFTQPILGGQTSLNVPLGYSSLATLRLTTLQTLPNQPDQQVGIVSSATIVPLKSHSCSSSMTAIHETEPTYTTQLTTSPSLAPLPLPIPIAPHRHNTSEEEEEEEEEEKEPKGIIVAISRSKHVLFQRKITLPAFLLHLLTRLLRHRLLNLFARLALYMLTFFTPLLGISLSLRWFRPEPKPATTTTTTTKEKGPLVLDKTRAQEMMDESIATKTTTWPAASPSSPDEHTPCTLYYDVEPVNGHVHVAFKGDAADDLQFTLDGTKVDASSSIVQTWQGENVHQFLIKAGARARLGVSIGT
ncbi:hypothetical protein CPB86DRAFT_780017 [Serendipita vermifera]|nr:hypothetical protein CPB86DRAFT_780017 [Serendipita vermifera]